MIKLKEVEGLNKCGVVAHGNTVALAFRFDSDELAAAFAAKLEKLVEEGDVVIELFRQSREYKQ